ncbi:hypothetical protein CHLRE_01g049250v5 [Chlamydomonas reinhardtii]|uniref:Uncharacterized protein n=1 Tax=Chlamydomonas reinhardtii TaxID=3055 RepID=A0A2K3E7X9_CHLRE|nr:uncharacterized protein CHLRE_01g049250v5 [Chlamydomonas reinhardtii]PNW88888.1 hypothetical protein CHLRE_01g049250v5 [Chlamydomonas reinhardtii]
MLNLSHLDVKREELEPIFKREGVELVTTWTTGVDGPKEEALAAVVRFYHDHFDLFMEALGGPEHKPAAMVKPAYRPPEPVATNRPAVPPLKDLFRGGGL